MPNGSYAVVVQAAGEAINRTSPVTADAAFAYGLTLPAGTAGSDFVRTDNDTAACTLTNGHSITNGKVDVFWDGGIRYNVDGVVAVDEVTLDGGSGDAFPANDTDVVVCAPVEMDIEIHGDDLVLIGMEATQRAHALFVDDGDVEVAAIELEAVTPQSFHQSGGATSPLAGNTSEKVLVSCGNSVGGGTVKILGMQNVTE